MEGYVQIGSEEFYYCDRLVSVYEVTMLKNESNVGPRFIVRLRHPTMFVERSYWDANFSSLVAANLYLKYLGLVRLPPKKRYTAEEKTFWINWELSQKTFPDISSQK